MKYVKVVRKLLLFKNLKKINIEQNLHNFHEYKQIFIYILYIFIITN